MRAVLLRVFGPPSALVATDLAEPVAGPGQVVIAVEYASVRPGGRFCASGLASGSFTQVSPAEAAVRNISGLRGGPPSPSEMRKLTQAALAEAAAGRLRPVTYADFSALAFEDRAVDALVGTGLVTQVKLAAAPVHGP